jgi:hypothetical protein
MNKRWEDDDDFQDDNLFPDIEGEDEDYEDEDDEELNSEYLKILEKREDIEIEKLKLIHKQLNFDVLGKSLVYLEKSWFWKFKSKKKKLDLLIETYQVFQQLVDMDRLSEDLEDGNLPI